MLNFPVDVTAFRRRHSGDNQIDNYRSPCKDCPKRKKKKAYSTVDRGIWPIFYLAARSDISIKGQRG